MNKRLCLLALAIAIFVGALAVAVWFLFFKERIPSFADAGGTVFLYAVEPRNPELAAEDMIDHTAEIVRNRLEADYKGTTVRVADKNHIEVRLVRLGEDHASRVGQVKKLLSATGHLEFAMLANQVDDAQGIEAAKSAINDPGEANLARLRKLAEKDEPPPGPVDPATGQPRQFQIRLSKGANSRVGYRWVEISPQERKALRLGKPVAPIPDQPTPGEQIANQRDKATTLRDVFEDLMAGALFYSRRHVRPLPKDADEDEAFDIFVLAREPEADEKDPAKLVPRLEGKYLTTAFADFSGDPNFRELDREGGRVSFSLNNEGAELLRQLSRKNLPTGDENVERVVRRHLAIILDGQVMTAPTINSEIGNNGQITGKFTRQEVHNLANILRAGALPTKLIPVDEREVAAGGK